MRLAESVAELGIVTPLIVSLQNDGAFIVVDGYRRYRAAAALGLEFLPCQVLLKTCSIKGCHKQHNAKGFCSKHYSRYRKHGDPFTVHPRLTAVCTIAGCGAPHCARGLCQRHYTANYRRERRRRLPVL